MKGLTGVVYGCKKSKPMVLYVQYLKVMKRYKVVCEGVPFFNNMNTKGVSFMPKMVYKKIRGWISG